MKVFIDLGLDCPQQFTYDFQSSDLVITCAKYSELNSQVIRCNNFQEIVARLVEFRLKKDRESNVSFVIFYSSKRLLPEIIKIALLTGLVRTEIVFGSKTYNIFSIFIIESAVYFYKSATDFIKRTKFRWSKGGNVEGGQACLHSGVFAFADTNSNPIPPVDDRISEFGQIKGMDHLVPQGFFSPSFFRNTSNNILCVNSLERLGRAHLHTGLDAVGVGAYIFEGGNKVPNRFPYFFLKDTHNIIAKLHMEISGTWINLTCFSSGYAHWILDVLPALVASRREILELKNCGLVLNSLEPFKKESLDLIGLSDCPIKILPIGCCIEVENLYNLRIPINLDAVINGFRPHPPYSYLSPMVNLLLNETCGGAPKPLPKKVYIQRAKGLERSVANEDEVIFELESLGFKAIDTSNMALCDQINLFKQVEFVIAPHGAGLSNIVFSSAINVIELMHPFIVRSHFARISLDMGHAYKIIMGTTFLNFKSNSFHIDIRELLRSIPT